MGKTPHSATGFSCHNLTRFTANREANKVNKYEESDTIMKKHSSIFISVAVAVFYFGLAGSLQAVPPPPNVPDGGSTGLMLVAAISGIGFLKWKLKL